ncbi:MAG: aldo/keto reductase [Terrimesophilobacter sp.]
MIMPRFTPLAYGAANVGNLYRALTDDQADAVLDAAWDAGIRYFDTAPHYGLGLSERRLGAFLATKPRQEFTLSTKVGRLLRPNPNGGGMLDDANDFAVPADLTRVWDFSADGIRRSLDESLQRLGLDRVDILYLHDPERYDLDAALTSGIPALTRLRDEGLVSAVGLGSMSTEALLAGATFGDADSGNTVDLLMVAGRFTLADQSALASVIPECRRRGIGIVTAAVFNSGLLATPPDSNARYDYGAVPADVLARVTAIAAVCADFHVDLPTAALQYTLREQSVFSVVVGGSTPEQLRQNAQRMHEILPDALWETLAAQRLIPA